MHRQGFALILLGFTIGLCIAGCAENLPTTVERSDSPSIIEGQVLEQGRPTAAQLFVVCADGSHAEKSTNPDGLFRLELEGRPVRLLAVKTGAFAELAVTSGRMIVELKPGEVCAPEAVPQYQLSDYRFGVYDTDSHGDVRFRYRYSFSRFLCINWMPNLGEGGPNPNNWTSWSISDFSAPWKGKKLLVPRRYRWFHQGYYGYSISRALVLIART